jgi:hypothetical protein
MNPKAFMIGAMLGIQIVRHDGEIILEFQEPERGTGNAAVTVSSTTTSITNEMSVNPFRIA